MHFCFSCLAQWVIATCPPLALPCWPVTTLEASAWCNCHNLPSKKKKEHVRPNPSPCCPECCLGHFWSLLGLLICKAGLIRDISEG